MNCRMYPGCFPKSDKKQGVWLTVSVGAEGKDLQPAFLRIKNRREFGLDDVPPGVLQKSAEEYEKEGHGWR